MSIRALRGAVQLTVDSKEEMNREVPALLQEMLESNGLSEADLVSVLFTVTPDLTSQFPAAAARTMGWSDIPLMCAVEIDVTGALERIIRVLMHVESGKSKGEIAHIYLHGATALRKDLAQ